MKVPKLTDYVDGFGYIEGGRIVEAVLVRVDRPPDEPDSL